MPRGKVLSVPALSVVMPVFNAGRFLDESIDSILGQTFSDFEFVVVDDLSTDGSRERLHEWGRRDSRIRAILSPARLGLSGSSNLAVRHARSDIVARMDADDLSHPDRLRQQWGVLANDPTVVLVGTLSDGINAAGDRIRPRDRWRILRRSPFAPFPHGSVMFRKRAFDAVGGYSEAAAGWEDQDLFHRLASQGPLVTLPDVLYRYRYHGQNSTVVHDDPRDRDSAGGRTDAPARHYARGAVRLWAGERPAIVRALLADPGTLRHWWGGALLVWAAWGEISPGTLRSCLRALTTARDRACGLWLQEGRPYEWRSVRLS